MIVVGSMIGSGIFIVAADISRQTVSAGGLLLTWILTGLLTISARFLTASWPLCFRTRRSIRLFARGLLAALGISLRLDAIPGDPDGYDRRGGGGIRALSWRFAASDFSERMGRSAHRPRVEVRDQPFGAAVGGRADDRVPDVHQYAGRAAWEADPECFTSAKTLSLLGLIFLGIFVGRNAGQ